MTSRYTHDESVVLNIHGDKQEAEPTPVATRKWRNVVAAAGIAASAGALSVAYMQFNEAPHMHAETQSMEEKLDLEPTVLATLTGVSFDALDGNHNGAIDASDLSAFLGPIYDHRIQKIASGDMDAAIQSIKTELIQSVHARQLECWTLDLSSAGAVTQETYAGFQDQLAADCPAAAFEPSTLDMALPQVDAYDSMLTIMSERDVTVDAAEAPALDGAPPAPAAEDLLDPRASSSISFEDLDGNKDQVLEDAELTQYVESSFHSMLAEVQNDASLTDDMKTLKTNLMQQQFETQSHCLASAMDRFKEQRLMLTPETFPLFEEMMDELCSSSGALDSEPAVDQEIAREGAQEETLLTTDDVPPPTEEEAVAQVLYATPDVKEEAVVEEVAAPVHEEEQQVDALEQAAEAGNPVAEEQVEQHEDAVEQKAESGDAAAVQEEEYIQAQVEQAADEGNSAAQAEEEHHEEQVKEAEVNAPVLVQEEEKQVDELEQAAEAGNPVALEQVEQKEEEVAQEAEAGSPEAVQVEEHIEAALEQGAQDGNKVAVEEEEHHEAQVAVADETTTADAPWTPSDPTYPPAEEVGTAEEAVVEEVAAPVQEEEHKMDALEQAAEAGNPVAVEQVEQHEDAVEQKAESGDAAAVQEEEYIQAQVEQAADEGNSAAQAEEEHHEEQVKEAEADAPAPVQEEEHKVDELEQAAEAGDQAAVAEVEQKEEQVAQEAEEGNPEAVQVEEHIEAEVEQGVQDGNKDAQAEEQHHEAEVAVADENTVTADAPWTPSDPTYPPSEEEAPLEQEQESVADIEQAIEERKPSEEDVVTNNSSELREELMNAFGVGSDSASPVQEPSSTEDKYETIVDPDVVVPSPSVDIDATSTLSEQLKEELTQAVETGAEDTTPVGDYDAPPTVDSQEVDAMANNLLEQVYASDGNDQVGHWNWLDPSTTTYGLVKDENEDVVNVATVGHYLMQQHVEKTTALITELLHQAITFNMTVTCFTAGLNNLQKDQLTKEEYFELIQWMNEKCHGEAPAAQGPEATQLMTKGEFKARIAMQFEPTLSTYYANVLGVKAEHDKVSSLRQSIDECLDKATENSVDPESGLVHASQLDAATMWILNVCVGN